MNNKNSRRDKIKLLQAISDGKLRVDDFQPPKTYFFIEHSNKPGVYEHEGKEYSEAEYRELCEKIKRNDSRSIIFNEGREYPENDWIIVVNKHSNPKPEPGAWNITLDLSK